MGCDKKTHPQTPRTPSSLLNNTIADTENAEWTTELPPVVADVVAIGSCGIPNVCYFQTARVNQRGKHKEGPWKNTPIDIEVSRNLVEVLKNEGELLGTGFFNVQNRINHKINVARRRKVDPKNCRTDGYQKPSFESSKPLDLNQPFRNIMLPSIPLVEDVVNFGFAKMSLEEPETETEEPVMILPQRIANLQDDATISPAKTFYNRINRHMADVDNQIAMRVATQDDEKYQPTKALPAAEHGMTKENNSTEPTLIEDAEMNSEDADMFSTELTPVPSLTTQTKEEKKKVRTTELKKKGFGDLRNMCIKYGITVGRNKSDRINDILKHENLW